MVAEKQISLEEIAKHATEESCWVIIAGAVYDVTDFLKDHPGGKKVLLKVGGKDGSREFEQFHDAAQVMRKYGEKMRIGRVATGAASAVVGKATLAVEERRKLFEQMGVRPFGNMIPFGDSAFDRDEPTPFYTDAHRATRAALRKYVEERVMPFVDEWDLKKEVPRGMARELFEHGLLPGCVGPPVPVEYLPAGYKMTGGHEPSEHDYRHLLIALTEMCRAGASGYMAAMFGGLTIGLPPVLKHGSAELRARVAPACLNGSKTICLCITEPSGGSDVANLRTEAIKSADGSHYVVNGEKKWITCGMWADYFTVACRTGGKGMGGVSLLLIERTMPGVTTRAMDCQGYWGSGTAYVTFDNVKVPVANLLGKENRAFRYIMQNFNHERFTIAGEAIGLSRCCIEESVAYAFKRKTFGKRLIDHPVIQAKIATMARQVESAQAWIELIAYQMDMMPHKMAMIRLGPMIALLKSHAAHVLELCAKEAAQIFGGASFTRGGVGGRVERIYREKIAHLVPGGSVEIMESLAVRMAVKMSML